MSGFTLSIIGFATLLFVGYLMQFLADSGMLEPPPSPKSDKVSAYPVVESGWKPADRPHPAVQSKPSANMTPAQQIKAGQHNIAPTATRLQPDKCLTSPP